jgi:hypothetical protein
MKSQGQVTSYIAPLVFEAHHRGGMTIARSGRAAELALLRRLTAG